MGARKNLHRFVRMPKTFFTILRAGKSVVADTLLKGVVRVRFQKAFDGVEREFLLKSLETSNFGQDLLQKYTKLCYEQHLNEAFDR